MTTTLRIDYLKHHPETIPMWTEHFWKEWNSIYREQGRSYEQLREGIAERCNTDRLPLAIVAFWGNQAVGTGCLKVGDLDARPELSPWVAAIYVVPEFRKQGIASRIVPHLEAEASRMGHTTLYLWTATAEALYTSLGWAVHERIHQFGQAITIMTKNAQRNDITTDD